MTNSALPVQSEKSCTKCHEVKPLTEFSKRKASNDGLTYWCKSCTVINNRKTRKPGRRNDDLVRKYGITLDQYHEMLNSQGGKCAICGTDDPGSHGFCVDHCHTTGAVRSILCHHCNVALGQVKEDLTIIKALENYVKVHTNLVP